MEKVTPLVAAAAADESHSLVSEMVDALMHRQVTIDAGPGVINRADLMKARGLLIEAHKLIVVNENDKDNTNDSLLKFEAFLRTIPQRTIANLLCSYIMESNHTSWDGHNPDNLKAYSELFDDIRQMYISSNPDNFKGLPPWNGVVFACEPELHDIDPPRAINPSTITVEHVVAMFPDLGGDPNDFCGDPLFPKKTKGEVIEAWIDYLSSLASRDIEQRLDD